MANMARRSTPRAADNPPMALVRSLVTRTHVKLKPMIPLTLKFMRAMRPPTVINATPRPKSVAARTARIGDRIGILVKRNDTASITGTAA